MGLCSGCCQAVFGSSGRCCSCSPMEPWPGGAAGPEQGLRNDSLEQPLARAGLTHGDFTAPGFIKAQNRCHSRFLAEHPTASFPRDLSALIPNPSRAFSELCFIPQPVDFR